jgi:hypothetical protein
LIFAVVRFRFNPMARNQKSKAIAGPRQELTEATRFSALAHSCYGLAAGAGDAKFALKLSAIANEYEAKAMLAEEASSKSKK